MEEIPTIDDEIETPPGIKSFENKFGEKAGRFHDIFIFPLEVSWEGFFRSNFVNVNLMHLDHGSLTKFDRTKFGKICLLTGYGYEEYIWHRTPCLIFSGVIEVPGIKSGDCPTSMNLEEVHILATNP